VDRFANTLVGSAAAYVATEDLVDIGIGWLRFLLQERRRGHDLAGLAVAALGHVVLDPSFLQRMVAVLGEALNGGHGLCADVTYGDLAALHLLAVEENGASAASADPASILRTGQSEKIAHNPKEGHIRHRFDRVNSAVYVQFVLGHCGVPARIIVPQTVDAVGSFLVRDTIYIRELFPVSKLLDGEPHRVLYRAANSQPAIPKAIPGELQKEDDEGAKDHHRDDRVNDIHL